LELERNVGKVRIAGKVFEGCKRMIRRYKIHEPDTPRILHAIPALAHSSGTVPKNASQLAFVALPLPESARL